MIKPVHDYVLVELEIQQNETTAGIILPQSSANEKPYNVATVLSVGPGIPDEAPICCEAGDRVLYSKFSGTQIFSEDPTKELFLVKNKDIQAIEIRTVDASEIAKAVLNN